MKPVSELTLDELDALLEERLSLLKFLEKKSLLFKYMDWQASLKSGELSLNSDLEYEPQGTQ